MSAQTAVDETSRFELLVADLKIRSGDLTGVPQQLADAVAQAGLEANPGTIVTSEHNKHGELSRKATGLGLKPHRARAASTNKKCLGEEKTCYSLRQTRSYRWAEA